MGIGGSVFLVALGAVLTFAIGADTVDIVNINTIGIILMVAGVIGLIISLIVSNNMGRRDDRVVTEERIVRDDRI